jgi:hypothetical protein
MALSKEFNIMQVDEETKQIVKSFMGFHQHSLLSSNTLLRNIPELVSHVVMLYYYRTHSIYEWKVEDVPQLASIKEAVPGQSFNHHFKLHKLDWFLKFYPNGTKQSKQGNVFLLLYLRSTPEISKMSATCKVWLKELDKGREHYKDFNEKNKYTGWRSGLVKTAEIANLEELTFQVTITIFEIYDKDQKNVTNKYIGLGVDQKQTISYLRKEVQFQKDQVQKLMIRMDDMKAPLQRKQSLSITSAIYPFPNNYAYNYDDDGADDEKNNYKSPSVDESVMKKEDEHVCNEKFERWLCDTVKLGQYLSAFRKNECNDVRMIEFFEEDAIEKEMGITKLFHRKLIMKKANEFKKAQSAFVSLLDGNNEIAVFKERLEDQGIVTLNELKSSVESKDDLMHVLGKEKAERSVDVFWEIIGN